MTAPSVGVKDLLVGASVGVFQTAGDWPIFISKMPDTPDAPTDCIAIFDGGGLESNPKWLLDYPDVTIMVRGASYQTLYQKIKDIKSVLVGLTSQTINGDRWDSVTQIGGFANLGIDKADRHTMTLTIRLILEPASSVLDVRQPL